MKPVQPPSGRTIILELVKEMEERLYPLLYRVLPPSVYHVYLHPDDYRDVEAVAPVIAADGQRGLSDRVTALNRRSRWQELLQGKQPPIEVPSTGWDISLHADANGELQRGQLGIVSRLSVPPAPTFEGGTPTTRIARTVVTGTIRQTTTRDEAPAHEAAPAAAPAPAPAPVPAPAATSGPVSVPLHPPAPLSPPQVSAGVSTSLADRPSPAASGVARLAYVDEQGPHVFVMRKDVVSIGRGGSAHWVDIQVASGARVSREHCRIRRADDGRFFLQDLSTWGTSVDGTRVQPYVRTSAAGQLEETGHEHELPQDARIQLADALLIEFQTLPGR
ncbi:MAG TPA: FHA domain-containing protein [Vicinamibacterales bacterium]|nr:FHA domain-containing protein [Vicinamibacterales bacterium]